MSGATRPERVGRHRTSSTTRTEAFSDGVFAIAITLLVLEIKVPTDLRGETLLHALLVQWPSYLSYLVTFVTVGTIWLNHHDFFSRIQRIDVRLQWANLALLLGVSFTPFPNALLAEYLRLDLWDEHARTAAAVYALVLALATVPWWFLWSATVSRPELLRPPGDAATARVQRRRSLVGIVVGAVAVPVAYAAPIVGLLLFGVAAVFYIATSEGLGRRSPESGPVID